MPKEATMSATPSKPTLIDRVEMARIQYLHTHGNAPTRVYLGSQELQEFKRTYEPAYGEMPKSARLSKLIGLDVFIVKADSHLHIA